MVDIGGFGKDNGASIFGQSDIALAFDNGELHVPADELNSGHLLPHVIISDEIFPLTPWLMKHIQTEILMKIKESTIADFLGPGAL